MQFVAEREGVTLSDGGAMFIARLSDGALRDALSLLDQCIGRGNAITADVVADVAGLAGREYLFKLSTAVREHDAASALKIIDELHKGSCDMERLCGELIEHFRNDMLAKTMKDPQSLLAVSPQEMEAIRAETAQWSLEGIISILDLLQTTQTRLHSGANGRVEMEMAFIKLTSPKLDGSMSSVLDRISKLERAIASGVPVPAADVKSTEKTPEPPAPKKPENIPEPIEFPTAFKQPETPKPVVPTSAKPEPEPPVRKPNEEAPPEPAPAREDELLKEWPEVLEELKKVDVSVLSILTDSQAYQRGNFILIDSPNRLFGEFVKRRGYASSIRKAIYQVTGRDYKLGIYKRQDTQTQTNVDALAMLELRARKMGIDVTIQE